MQVLKEASLSNIDATSLDQEKARDVIMIDPLSGLEITPLTPSERAMSVPSDTVIELPSAFKHEIPACRKPKHRAKQRRLGKQQKTSRKANRK